MLKLNVRKIAFAGVIAALYAAMTMALAPISYGPVQFRIAEALCVLPFFFPFTAWGLFIGCIAANLILSPYPLDVLVGSFATLIAAICTMRLGLINRDRIVLKIAACFPPVLLNAVFIGLLIAYYTVPTGSEAAVFLYSAIINGLWVGFGQFVVLYALGLPLLIFLPKSKFFSKLNL